MSNLKYCRNAIISIDVTRYWLTDDGEYPDCDGGWEELEKQLTAVARKLNDGKDLEVHFQEWQDQPEEVTL